MRSGKMSHRLKLAVAIVLASGSSATAQTELVVPNNMLNTLGGGTLNTVVRDAGNPRTYQIIYAASELTSVVGMDLIGITWRMSPQYVAFPSTTAIWDEYQIRIATTAITPAGMSTSFAANFGGNEVLVRSGPLTLSVGFFPSITAPNPFGGMIAFQTPFRYTGGNLVIEIRHPGGNFVNPYGYLEGLTTTQTSLGYGATVRAISQTVFASPVTGTYATGYISKLFFTPHNPGATGACCFSNGDCQFITHSSCLSAGGSFRGENVTCAAASCPQPGACCFFTGTCAVLLPAECLAQGGLHQGAASVCSSCPTVLYTNCNLSTGTSTLNGTFAPPGALWSECARDEFNLLVANTYAAYTASAPSRLADDITVPAGGLHLAYLKVPVITPNATSFTVTGATLRILTGPPNQPGSQVVFGDPTSNRLTHREWSNIYRIFSSVVPGTCGGTAAPPHTNFRIQWAYIAVDHFLTEGTYWLDWNFSGTTTSLFVPSATRASAIGRTCNPANSNAFQFFNGVWAALVDNGQGCSPWSVQQDHYFELLGTPPQTCYANCDGSTVPPILNVEDFACFINQFAAAQSLPPAQQLSHYANCDGSTIAPVLNVEDFACFINRFALGCP
jgi:hypothetical protein